MRASLTPRDQESWKDNPGKRGGAFISSSDGSTIDYGLRCSYLASSDADDVRLGKVPALSLRLVWQIRCICTHVSNIWHVALHCTSLPPGRAKGTSVFSKTHEPSTLLFEKDQPFWAQSTGNTVQDQSSSFHIRWQCDNDPFDDQKKWVMVIKRNRW